MIIGASVSEPPSSDTNGDFLLYIYIYYILCVVRRAAYPKLIQFNARNVNNSADATCSSNSSARVPESSRNREDRLQRIEESERELVVPLKPRNRERNG